MSIQELAAQAQAGDNESDEEGGFPGQAIAGRMDSVRQFKMLGQTDAEVLLRAELTGMLERSKEMTEQQSVVSAVG